MAAHARDVNIFIWTSRKSVDYETNDRVMVHGDGTRADALMSMWFAQIDEIVARETDRAAGSLQNSKSNV